MNVKLMTALSLLVMILKANVSLAKGSTDDLVEFPLSASVNQCQEIYQSDEVQSSPTAYRRGFNTNAEACFKRAMNRELDKRLVTLKSKDTAAFKREIELQRSFNASVKSYCSGWEEYYQKCCSACSFTEESECKMNLYRYREGQARLINSRRMKVGAEIKHTKEIAIFSEFAATLCSLSNLGWQENVPPVHCVDKVLADLDKAVVNVSPDKQPKCVSSNAGAH